MDALILGTNAHTSVIFFSCSLFAFPSLTLFPTPLPRNPCYPRLFPPSLPCSFFFSPPLFFYHFFGSFCLALLISFSFPPNRLLLQIQVFCHWRGNRRDYSNSTLIKLNALTVYKTNSFTYCRREKNEKFAKFDKTFPFIVISELSYARKMLLVYV